MYSLQEQETTINIIKVTGEFMVYSCIPHHVEQMIKAAELFKVPIKVKDEVNGFPCAATLQVSDYAIFKYIANCFEC